MNRIFVDTSFYIALFNPRDDGHAQAVDWSRRVHQSTLVTEFVLIEVANFLAETPSRSLFGELVPRLRANRFVEILPASSELFEAGVALYTRRADKHWSLTDCTS